jgi:hypothetical protein
MPFPKLPKGMNDLTLWGLWCLIFGSAVIWLLVGAVGYWVKLGWLPKDASDWVQAIGSVIAIFVAVIVPARMKAHETQRRHIESIEGVVATFYQFRHLISEAEVVLGSPVGNQNNGSNGWAREFVYDRCLDIIERLNTLSLKSSNVIFLKLLYDARMEVMGFVNLIYPDNISGPSDRVKIINALSQLKSDVQGLITSETLYLESL